MQFGIFALGTGWPCPGTEYSFSLRPWTTQAINPCSEGTAPLHGIIKHLALSSSLRENTSFKLDLNFLSYLTQSVHNFCEMAVCLLMIGKKGQMLNLALCWEYMVRISAGSAFEPTYGRLT